MGDDGRCRRGRMHGRNDQFLGRAGLLLVRFQNVEIHRLCVAYVYMYTCIPPSRGVDPGPAHDIYTEPLRFFRVFRVIQGYPVFILRTTTQWKI